MTRATISAIITLRLMMAAVRGVCKAGTSGQGWSEERVKPQGLQSVDSVVLVSAGALT